MIVWSMHGTEFIIHAHFVLFVLISPLSQVQLIKSLSQGSAVISIVPEAQSRVD